MGDEHWWDRLRLPRMYIIHECTELAPSQTALQHIFIIKLWKIQICRFLIYTDGIDSDMRGTVMLSRDWRVK